MIEKLTREQEKGIIEWQQHCLKIGRDTSPINKKLTEESWCKFYKILGKQNPKFWYCQSPLQAQIIINIFPEIKRIFSIEKGANIGANIKDNVWANIWANIKANIGDNVRDNIWDNIGDNVRDNVWANIGDNVRDNIGDNVWANKLQLIDTWSWCQHDISWIGYYKYFEKYGLLPTDKNFEIFNVWYDLARSCGWCYTFEKIVFVCEKPNKLFLNNRGQLHKDGNMALEYSDGYGLYMLNGVKVPEWLVETKAEEIDPQKAIDEKSADVQREIIRKIGAERLLKKLNAKEISIYKDNKTGCEYKLMRMNIGNIDRKYLYFEHASIKGIFYCKGVPPECNSALSGFAWTRKLLNREELKNIDIAKEAELIANLPERIS